MADQRQGVLASDAERERVALVLRDAAAEGRLTLEELSDRVAAAYSSRTSTDLDALTRDLPKLAAVSTLPERRSRARWIVAVMSGAKRQGRWRPADHCTAVAVMGGCVPGTPVIRVRVLSVMGGVAVKSKRRVIA
jgi:hypothetical protein